MHNLTDSLSPGQFLGELSIGDALNWERRRSSVSAVALQLLDGPARHSERLLDCSRFLEFVLCDDPERKLRLTDARFCRVRLCPICQWRRSLMWFARLSRALPPFLEQYPKTRWLFLTLTIRNCEISDLKETCKAMGKAWERLSKLKAFPGFAWFRSLEVTRAENGLAHPHYHVLLAVTPSYFTGKKYLSQEKWVQLWRKSLRLDYNPVVDIQAVKPKKYPGEQQDLSTVSAKTLAEVAKYEVKPDDLLDFNDSAWVCELAKQLRGVRSVNVGGPLRQFLTDDEPEDLITENIDDVPQDVAASLVFGWKEQISRYRLQSFNKV